MGVRATTATEEDNMDGFKITNVDHLDQVDLCEEEQTLTDGSTVHNVVLRTADGYARFFMTDEKSMIDFVSGLKKLLDKYGDKMTGVGIDAEWVPR